MDTDRNEQHNDDVETTESVLGTVVGVFVAVFFAMLFVMGAAVGAIENGPIVWVSILFGVLGVFLGFSIGGLFYIPKFSLAGAVLGATICGLVMALIPLGILTVPLTTIFGATITGLGIHVALKRINAQGRTAVGVPIIGALVMGLLVFWGLGVMLSLP